MSQVFFTDFNIFTILFHYLKDPFILLAFVTWAFIPLFKKFNLFIKPLLIGPLMEQESKIEEIQKKLKVTRDYLELTELKKQLAEAQQEKNKLTAPDSPISFGIQTNNILSFLSSALPWIISIFFTYIYSTEASLFTFGREWFIFKKMEFSTFYFQTIVGML